jgi:hypothetical protein
MCPRFFKKKDIHRQLNFILTGAFYGRIRGITGQGPGNEQNSPFLRQIMVERDRVTSEKMILMIQSNCQKNKKQKHYEIPVNFYDSGQNLIDGY